MISIIIPSRNRPDELLFTLNNLKLKENGLEALVWLDSDDPKLEKYKELFGSNPNVRLFIKKRVGYINFHLMLNFLCSKAKYNWIFEMNDDAYMENPDWFTIVKNFVREFEPTNQPIVLNIWGQGETTANLFPIVSKKYLEILGHFAMISACDTWTQTVARLANISYDIKNIKPTHRKFFESKDAPKVVDETYREVHKAVMEAKQNFHPERSPWRQMIRQDASKIIQYNMSKEACQNLSSIKTIGFIGLGKLGLPVAEAISARGFTVIGYDIEAVKTSLPLASSITDLVKQSDLVFCAVQTPHNSLYEGDKPLPKERADFDYSYLIQAVKDVASVDKKTNLVVISTCLPGTFNNVIKPFLRPNVNYLYNPFFIAMGTVVENFLNPEFVLIGGEDPTILKFFYTKLHGRDRTFVTDTITAEGIKVFYNTYITAKTVLGNMYGEFAHKTGMNVDHIYQALSLGTDRITSSKYLRSGVGDGGSCHPRDNIALSFLANKLGLSFNIFDALMIAREKHMEWLADIFAKEISKSGLLGIILGKSFKPGVSIEAGSAAILMANILRERNIPFYHSEFDYPKVLPQAVYFIATQHEKYKELPYPAGSLVIDPFRYIPSKAGVEIISIGKKNM